MFQPETPSSFFGRPGAIFRSPQRNAGIDVLRGLSILMVFCCHFSLLPAMLGNPTGLFFGRTVGDIGTGMGYYGVALFFVISGFLITNLTLRRYQSLPKINFSEFWWFRFSRIMPMVGLCVAAMAALHLAGVGGFVFGTTADLLKAVSAILAFRFNEVMGGSAPGIWNPLWSLSVEEMFYLAFPLVCLLLTGKGSLVWVFLVAIATSLYFKFSGTSGPYSTWACVDLLSVGCLLAVLRPIRLRTTMKAGRRLGLAALVSLLGLGIIASAVVGWHPFANNLAPLFCGLGAAAVITASQLYELKGAPAAIALPLSILGVVSYEAYLVHQPLRKYLDDRGVHAVALQLGVVIVAALLLHTLFSEPMNQLLRHWAKRRAEGKKVWLRASLLVAAPLLVLALLPRSSRSLDARPFFLHFVDVATLPDGVSEPLACLGQKGQGDLVFLRHLGQDKVQVGIDHWGGSPALSAPIDRWDFARTPLEIVFGATRTEVRQGDKVLVKNDAAPYARSGKVKLGSNQDGFTSAGQFAQSDFFGDSQAGGRGKIVRN